MMFSKYENEINKKSAEMNTESLTLQDFEIKKVIMNLKIFKGNWSWIVWKGILGSD